MNCKVKLEKILRYETGSFSQDNELNLINLQNDNDDDEEFRKFKQWFLKQFEATTTTLEENEADCDLGKFSIFFFDFIHEKSAHHLSGTDNGKTIICAAGATTTKSHDTNDDSDKSFNTPTTGMPKKEVQQPQAEGKRANYAAITFGDFLINETTPLRIQRSKQKISLSQQQQKQPTSVKRVQPLTVTTSGKGKKSQRELFGNSAFSHDNNIMNITSNLIELDIRQSLAVDRQCLKNDVHEMTKIIKAKKSLDYPPNKPQFTSTPVHEQCESLTLDVLHDELNLKSKNELQILAAIFNLLMDLNYAPNVLQELAFLYDLMSASKGNASNHNNNQNIEDNLLQNYETAIYFAALCLYAQRALFNYFDAKTLITVIASKRLKSIGAKLHNYLCNIRDRKQKLLDIAQKQRLKFQQKTVYMQETEDSRSNFPSMLDFHAYKIQRDLFYEIFNLWEGHHLRPNWSLHIQLGHKIQEIFDRCEQPINMLHLSKLFVSQLLLGHSYSSMTPGDLGLDINMLKFRLLSQRLVTAEHFNMDYEFHGHQLFFCEFLCATRSLVFIEQLKMHLYARLMELNNGMSGQFNVYSVSSEGLEQMANEHSVAGREYVVRAELLQDMIILAKFLAYVLQLPYVQKSASEDLPNHLMHQQLKLRSQFPSYVDLHNSLQEAIVQHKLLITLPWLVQYMTMLDDTELRLANCQRTLHLMFNLLTCASGCKCVMLTPCSYFVLRCCLGWLAQNKRMVADEFILLSHSNKISAELQMLKQKIVHESKNINVQHIMRPCTGAQLAIILEDVIKIACPALAQFRACIVRSSQAFRIKSQSRSGRYRHITTRYTATIVDTAGVSEEGQPELNQQLRLKQVFLEQQSASMRRMLDFLIEHVVRLAEHYVEQTLFAPMQVEAEKQAQELQWGDYEELYALVERVYENLGLRIMINYESEVQDFLRASISQALEALLPKDVIPELQKIYFNFIKDTCFQHMQEYRLMHLDTKNYMCKEVSETTQRLFKRCQESATSGEGIEDSTELQLVAGNAHVSRVLEELQYWLHLISLRFETCSDLHSMKKLSVFLLTRIRPIFVHKLPTHFYIFMAFALVGLLKKMIINIPEHVSAELMTAVGEMLTCEHMKMENVSSVMEYIDVEEDDKNENGAKIHKSDNTYKSLITLSFLRQLGNCSVRYNKYCDLLILFINLSIISINFINERFIRIFKEDLQLDEMKLISTLLRRLSVEAADLVKKSKNMSQNSQNEQETDAKDALFLELLADMSTDKNCI